MVKVLQLQPIELISFDAKLNGGEVELNWITGSEINNDYFTIERSKDVLVWDEIKNVNGAGNSNQTLNYFEIDVEPLNGISYYRLKQTDFDGLYSYSEIISVNFDYQSNLTFYPNPTENILIIKGDKTEFEALSIFNVLGQNVIANVNFISVNETTFVLDLSNLQQELIL